MIFSDQNIVRKMNETLTFQMRDVLIEVIVPNQSSCLATQLVRFEINYIFTQLLHKYYKKLWSTNVSDESFLINFLTFYAVTQRSRREGSELSTLHWEILCCLLPHSFSWYLESKLQSCDWLTRCHLKCHWSISALFSYEECWVYVSLCPVLSLWLSSHISLTQIALHHTKITFHLVLTQLTLKQETNLSW